MNREALMKYLEEEDYDYGVKRGGIEIYNCYSLSNRTLREIGACNGRLKFGAEVMVVNDE